VWRFKYLLIGMIFPALLGVGGYLAAPRITDKVRDSVRDSAAESVQSVFDKQTPPKIKPGQIVIAQSRLAAAVNDSANQDESWHLSGMTVIIEDGQVKLVTQNRSSTNDEATIFSVVPAIQNGKFVLTQREGLLNIFKTAQDSIADEIELQTNQLFTDSGVVPVSVTAVNGRLVIVTQGPGQSGSTSATPTAASGLGSLLKKTPTSTSTP
jgi:hypothetical protein